MTTEQKQLINEKATDLAKSCGLVVLHFVIRGTDSRPVIEIVLDGPKAVGLEDCETVHRQLLEFIDNTINKAIDYRLDVLSPGTDEPIRYNYQLERSIGKTVVVSYDDEGKGVQKTGVLGSYDANTVTIVGDSKQVKGQPRKAGPEIVIPRSAVSLIKQVALIR
jgi:ribosome maturation factor RimP